jgi:hypothetical protein
MKLVIGVCYVAINSPCSRGSIVGHLRLPFFKSTHLMACHVISLVNLGGMIDCRRCGVLCCDPCSTKKFVEPGKAEKLRACDGCYLQLVEKRQQRLIKKRLEEKEATLASQESKAKKEKEREDE